MFSASGRIAWYFLTATLLIVFASAASAKQDGAKPDEARLKPAYRFARGGWIYVHLEGSPADIGYQHGYLLAPEIEDGFNTGLRRRTYSGRTLKLNISRNCKASPMACKPMVLRWSCGM